MNRKNKFLKTIRRSKIKKETIIVKPGAPYAKAVISNGFVFVSGRVAVDSKTNQPLEGGAGVQTRQILEDLKEIAEEAGTSFDKIVKVSVFLKEISDFAEMNAVYKEYFPETPPARTTVQAELSKPGFLVEIDFIAVL